MLLWAWAVYLGYLTHRHVDAYGFMWVAQLWPAAMC